MNLRALHAEPPEGVVVEEKWSSRLRDGMLHFFEQRVMIFPVSRKARRPCGFTLVELVVVIVIVGVMALVAIPRFTGVDSFKSRGFYDEATGVVRYAQKTAIAWRSTTIYVCVTATSLSAGTAAGCATPLTHPTTGGALAASAPSGVTLSPVGDFTFNGLGKPSAGTTITLTSTIAGDPARQIVVEAETGYVHP